MNIKKFLIYLIFNCFFINASEEAKKTLEAIKSNPNLNHLLLIAAINNSDRAEVQQLLRHQFKVNIFGDDWMTALMKCACIGDSEVVELLIKHGVDLNKQDKDGRTALIMAIEVGYYYNLEKFPWISKQDLNNYAIIIKLLVDNGADLNIRTKEGYTALMHAVNVGDEDLVKLLLNKGAKVNIQDERGDTALTYAVFPPCNKEIVELLIKYDINAINIINKANKTPLIIALDNGQKEIVDLMIASSLYKDIEDL